ncbi:MAG: DNA recombination/repair protein RecA, partial [Dehalococcoidia bacterium]|nr:DNA recombination/repair protein RecA [Dehalococcoidia bacterium]
KNKVAPPFRQAEFDIMFTSDMHGINHWGDVIDLAVEHDVIKKTGAFYSYGDVRLGQGRMNAVKFLGENLEMGTEIEQRVRSLAGVKGAAPVESFAPPATAEAVEAEAELSVDA